MLSMFLNRDTEIIIMDLKISDSGPHPEDFSVVVIDTRLLKPLFLLWNLLFFQNAINYRIKIL